MQEEMVDVAEQVEVDGIWRLPAIKEETTVVLRGNEIFSFDTGPSWREKGIAHHLSFV